MKQSSSAALEGDSPEKRSLSWSEEGDSPEKRKKKRKRWSSVLSLSSSSWSEEGDSPEKRKRKRWSSWDGIESLSSQSVCKSKILNLNFEHIGGTLSNSLYQIPISDIISSPKSSIPKPELITPTITFDDTEYPSHMGCCQLGDNFFFMGGIWSRKPYPTPYPNKVHIYNPTTKTVSEGTPMNTGKPQPQVFVYSGKLYVFSNGEAFLDAQVQASGAFHIFEFYDPSSNTWSPIDPPSYVSRPFMYPPFLTFHGHAIIDNKLYLATCLHRNMVILSYDLDTHTWDPRPSPLRYTFKGRAELVHNMLYAPIPCNSVAAYGPVFEEGGQISKKLFHQMAMVDCYEGDPLTSSEPEIQYVSSSSLVNLGDNTLCRVVTRDYLLAPHAHDITLSIFQPPTDYHSQEDVDIPRIPTTLLHTSSHIFPTDCPTILLDAFLSTPCTGKLEEDPDLHTHLF